MQNPWCLSPEMTIQQLECKTTLGETLLCDNAINREYSTVKSKCQLLSEVLTRRATVPPSLFTTSSLMLASPHDRELEESRNLIEILSCQCKFDPSLSCITSFYGQRSHLLITTRTQSHSCVPSTQKIPNTQLVLLQNCSSSSWKTSLSSSFQAVLPKFLGIPFREQRDSGLLEL